MPTGSIQIYASVAGQAAPLRGVQVAVLDESGVTVARLTTDEAGAAEAANLTAPDASYSLQETNTAVRPYAVYRLRADASGWQSQILDGVQVFDGQQTVARLEFLPSGGDGDALPAREAAAQTITIPPHVLFAGDGGSGPAPEERLPGNVLSEVVVPRKITVHLGRPAASASNVTVSFQSYIANVASSEVYPTWVDHAVLLPYPAPAGQPRLHSGKVGAGDKPLVGVWHYDPLGPGQPHTFGGLVTDLAAAALL